MNKIFLIIQREYITRIRKRVFWVATFLLPLFYVGMIFGTRAISNKTQKKNKIALFDSSGLIKKDYIPVYSPDDNVQIDMMDMGQLGAFKDSSLKGYDGYIVISSSDWKQGAAGIYKAEKTPGIMSRESIRSKIESIWNRVKDAQLGLDAAKLAERSGSRIEVGFAKEDGNKAETGFATLFAYICGIMIYIIILVYGSAVMMGVMEEKTNRIAEVVISSVRPFQLMLGKIVGIGLVGLTQFLLWIVFLVLVYNLGKITGSTDTSMIGSAIAGMQSAFSSINVPLVLFCFIFYFLGGFFFYASIYAAIGSVVNEDIKEAQSLSFPVTMLVIFSVIMLTPAVENPTGPVAFWGSLLPFSSPIIMLSRIPFGVPSTVPWWQLLLSMSLLIGGFLFTTWMSARIYRTGILMYGKKVTAKEMIKWLFRRQ
jgi:ABC-2 type transport system permease protein